MAFYICICTHKIYILKCSQMYVSHFLLTKLRTREKFCCRVFFDVVVLSNAYKKMLSTCICIFCTAPVYIQYVYCIISARGVNLKQSIYLKTFINIKIQQIGRGGRLKTRWPCDFLYNNYWSISLHTSVGKFSEKWLER